MNAASHGDGEIPTGKSAMDFESYVIESIGGLEGVKDFDRALVGASISCSTNMVAWLRIFDLTDRGQRRFLKRRYCIPKFVTFTAKFHQ